MSKIAQRISMKAVIVNNGKILLLRKALHDDNGGHEGKWNLPGGRVEVGEHWQDALRREVMEETSIKDLDIGMPIYVGEWQPVISGTPTQIICTFMACKTSQSQVTLNEEHDKYIWIEPDKHTTYEILEPEGEVIDTFIKLTKSKMIEML